MIDRIHGKIISVKEFAITLALGPIELLFNTAQSASCLPGQDITLWTYLHWNQENGPSLFGFITELDRTVFLLITSCSGIGPKIALSVINHLGSAGCLKAIHDQDIPVLSKVSGIGPKKAEQIIVQLKRSVATLLKDGIDLGSEKISSHWQTIDDVLSSLGYTRPEIQRSLTYLKQEYGQNEDLSFDQLMRHALSFLSKK